MTANPIQAPAFDVQEWLGTDQGITLETLRGQVIAVFAFQLLCPGCVEHSIPQAKRVHAMFSSNDLTVIGLHTVFEHHAAMGRETLKAFMHEYAIDFPVGIDRPSGNELDPIPSTMRQYNMGGTPTLLLIDRHGRLRKHKMVHEHDLVLGAELMALLREDDPAGVGTQDMNAATSVCTAGGCR